MPIKSSFLPKEALQGQDIPSHILWRELNYDFIKLDYSKNIRLKEVYNVLNGDRETLNNQTLFRKVEVDGYLGVVFSCNILPEKMVDEKIVFSFVLGSNVVETLPFSVHLFRPDISYGALPRKIVVNPKSGETSPKILVKNLGEGTAIIDIEVAEESELAKSYPQFMEKFMEDFVNGIQRSIEKLQKEFPEFKLLLNQLGEVLTKRWEFDEKSLQQLEKLEKDFFSALEKDETFFEAVGEMLVTVLLKNSELSNMYQFMLEYVDSIGKEKILIKDPLAVIKLTRKPAKLKLKLRCIDLLKQMGSPFDLDPVEIQATSDGEIALFKLFEWGQQKQ